MIGICYSDIRMYYLYQNLKKHTQCVLLEDTSVLPLELDVLILPLSGVKDNQMLMMRGFKMHAEDEFFEMVKPEGCIISGTGYGLAKFNRKVVNLDEFNEFMNANAALTAEGILFLVLDNTKMSLKDIQFDIIGYGRCGKAMYDLLKKLDCSVRVIRRESDEFTTVEQYQKLIPGNVIINTSLSNIIDDILIKKMDDTLIINIVGEATFDEIALRKHNSKVIHAGPLPSLLSPITASRILYETVMEVLK